MQCNGKDVNYLLAFGKKYMGGFFHNFQKHIKKNSITKFKFL